MIKNYKDLNDREYVRTKPFSLLVVGCTLIAWLFIFIPDSALKASEMKSALGVAAISGTFSPLVKSASTSVVNISTVRIVKSREKQPLQDDPLKDFFERFFGDKLPRTFKQQNLGTGFIIDGDGHILTNNHVIDQTNEIKIRLFDGREFAAGVVGRDAKTDMAIIRIKSDQRFVPLKLGDSDRVEVGDWVVAIGNPFGLGNTVTAGIVSAKYRQIGAGPYDNFIQTDTPINLGNSGGPLLNMQGEVIGMNTAIFSQMGGSIGIGFAIPINMAKDIIPQLKKGRVVRGTIGVTIQKITPELKEKLNLKDENGALVSDVTSDGPAGNAGIRRRDVIVSFNGKDIKESSQLPYIVSSTPIGRVVSVGIIREGQRGDVDVEIEELKEDVFPPVEAEKSETFWGMTVAEINPELAKEYGLSETAGIFVAEVEDDSPSAESGLMPGDIIVEMDQVRVKDRETFSNSIMKYQKGDTILFLVNRDGTTIYLTLTVG